MSKKCRHKTIQKRAETHPKQGILLSGHPHDIKTDSSHDLSHQQHPQKKKHTPL